MQIFFQQRTRVRERSVVHVSQFGIRSDIDEIRYVIVGDPNDLIGIAGEMNAWMDDLRFPKIVVCVNSTSNRQVRWDLRLSLSCVKFRFDLRSPGFEEKLTVQLENGQLRCSDHEVEA